MSDLHVPTPPRPPRFSRGLLARALHPADRDCALTDLDDEFSARASRDGRIAARRWYLAQVHSSIVPSLKRRWFGGTRSANGRTPRFGPRMLGPEFRWAWRGLRARGAGAFFFIGLVALALGSSAVVFSAADAFVFRRVPYSTADRLVVIQATRQGTGTSDYFPQEVIVEWRKQDDLFAAVHGYLSSAYIPGGSFYITTGDVTESIPGVAVSPGLPEMLGVRPRWGRAITDADAARGAPPVVVIAESLAQRLFGDPARAIDQPLQPIAGSPRIIGVMPASFRFPSAVEQIWRPIDITAPLAENKYRSSLRTIALAAPGVRLSDLAKAVTERALAVAQTQAVADAPIPPRNETVTAVSLTVAQEDPRAAVVFRMLIGAAACLLLIACLNIASLELAGAIKRTRAYGIQSALGATRASLVRTAFFESLLLTGVAAIVAAGFAWWGVSLLATSLPAAMRNALVNPVDLDGRTVVFLGAAGIVTALLTSLPVVLRASRAKLTDALQTSTRTTLISRAGAMSRQVLMSAEVALTVLLLATALIYFRTYLIKVGETKGLDTANVVGVMVSETVRSPDRGVALEQALLTRVRALPFVKSVARTSGLPPSTQAGITGNLKIGTAIEPVARVKIANYDVDPEYFETMGIRLQAGRWFNAADPARLVVIDEAMARKYWPNGDALGAQFNMGKASFGGPSTLEIVGVTSHVRNDAVSTATGEDLFLLHTPISANYAPLTFVAKLDHPDRLGDLLHVMRAAAANCVVRADMLDDRYARLYGDTRVAASVTSGFGVLAFLIAMAGVYGVMAFLVAGRTREIGIRLALGARASDVRRLVLKTSGTFVSIGIVAGLLATIGALRVFQAQLGGVLTPGISLYAVVALAVFATAQLATWRPARRAARVDPALTLRNE